MPYSYTGNFPDQQVANSGIFSPADALNLSSFGEYGGSLELIEEVNITSDTAQIDFSNIKQNKFDVHLLQYENFKPTTDGQDVRIRFFESGVLEDASVYQYAHHLNQTSGALEQRSTGIAYIRAGVGTGNNTGERAHAYVYFYNLGNNEKYSFVNYHSVNLNTTTTYGSTFGGAILPQATIVDGIRVYSGGGITTITAKLFGLKQI